MSHLHFESIQFRTCLRNILDHETLDLVLDGTDLSGQVTGLVGGDGAGNDGARNTGGTAESHLAGDVDVGNLVLMLVSVVGSRVIWVEVDSRSCPQRGGAGGGQWRLRDC